MTPASNPLASRFRSPLDSPGFRFWQTFLNWQRRLDARLAPFNLTQPTFSLLAITGWLADRNQALGGPASVRQKVIVELSGLQKIQVSQWLRRLEAGGLIKLAPFPHDRREQWVDVTERGWEVLRQAMVIVEETDREQLARVHIDEP